MDIMREIRFNLDTLFWMRLRILMPFLFVLTACSHHQQAGAINDTLSKPARVVEKVDTVFVHKSVQVSDSLAEDSSGNNLWNKAESYVKQVGAGDDRKTIICNYSFLELNLVNPSDVQHYVVKKMHWTKRGPADELAESIIKVDIFNPLDSSIAGTINTNANEIEFYHDYYSLENYGCCGDEDRYEFRNYWTNQSFLKFDEKYYSISSDQAGLHFLFGYVVTKLSSKDQTVGELYFAHSQPFSRSAIDGHKLMNKVLFKMKSKTRFNKMSPFLPEISLVKHSTKDRITNTTICQELRIDPKGSQTDLMQMDITGLRIKFGEGFLDKPIIVNIPLKNGYLFGEANNLKKVIYLD